MCSKGLGNSYGTIEVFCEVFEQHPAAYLAAPRADFGSCLRNSELLLFGVMR